MMLEEVVTKVTELGWRLRSCSAAVQYASNFRADVPEYAGWFLLDEYATAWSRMS